LARFSLTGFGCGDVQDVFPEAACLPQVDHDRSFFTAFIKQKLHSTNHAQTSEEHHATTHLLNGNGFLFPLHGTAA
jgi:hypothetical protein